MKVKKELSPILMAIPGINGVGVGKDHIHVYLIRESKKVRKEVHRIFSEQYPDIKYEVAILGIVRPL